MVFTLFLGLPSLWPPDRVLPDRGPTGSPLGHRVSAGSPLRRRSGPASPGLGLGSAGFALARLASRLSAGFRLDFGWISASDWIWLDSGLARFGFGLILLGFRLIWVWILHFRLLLL